MQLGNHPVLKRLQEAEDLTDFKIGEKAYEVIEKIDLYPTDSILAKNITIFQREIKAGRVKKIRAKMKVYGYDPANPVVLGEDGKLIDGQHRTLSAASLDITHIPAIIARFRSPRAKAEYFVTKSRPEGGAMATVDRLRAELSSGNIYAKYIYKLCRDDSTSIFHGRVGLKGVPSPKSKMSPVVFLKIFNWIGLNHRRGWEQQSSHSAETKIRELSYQEIKDRMNDFGFWFFSWVSTNDKLVYRDKIITGILDFYLMMIRQADSNLDSLKKASIKKLQLFDFKDCLKMERSSIPSNLLSFYNGKKKRYRMKEISLAVV